MARSCAATRSRSGAPTSSCNAGRAKSLPCACTPTARAAYLSLRGDHAQAIAAYEAILPVDEPPQDLEQALLVQLRRAQSTGEALDSDTKIIESLRAARASGKPANNQAASEENHRFLVLTTRREGVSRTIGGVILTVDLSTSVELDAQFLQAVAEAVRPLDGTNQ